ncbi:MAG: DUF481 domain-containing protein [Phycisphaerae bacterium]|nr:DUF481 domain-containing protein [Phycisphaerae bacterium]
MKKVIDMFLLVLLLTSGAFADQLIMKDGDVVNGTTVGIKGGKLMFKSDTLGTLKVDIAKIAKLETENALPMILVDEEKSVERKLKIDDDVVTVITGGSSKVVKAGDIKDFGEHCRDPYKFVKSFQGDFGMALREGNTEKTSFTTDFKFEAENPNWIYAAYFNSRYGRQTNNGVSTTTDDEKKAGGRVGRKVSKRFSYYGAVDFEIDPVEEIDYLATLTAGVGMRWVETDHVKYENRFGFGYQRMKEYQQAAESSPIASLESDLRYKINSSVDFQQLTIYRPVLDDFQQYRITADTAFLMYLNESQSIYFKIGVKHDYNSQASDNVEKLDTYYFSNIGFKF